MTFLFALLPLFVVHGVIGAYQTRLFAEGHFRTLIASIVLLAALLSLVWIDAHPASDLIEITAAMLTLLIVLINLQHLRDRRSSYPALLPLRDWVRLLAEVTGPVTVGRLRIPGWIPAPQRAAVIKLMQRTFQHEGHFAFRTPATLVYYRQDAQAGDHRPLHLALQAATGAAANHAAALPGPLANGTEALARLRAEGWIEPSASMSTATQRPDSLVAAFRSLFADGIVFDADTLEGTIDMRKLDQSFLSIALPAAVRGHQAGTTTFPLSDRLITPIFHHGKLRILFVTPPQPDAEPVESWIRIVRAWQIAVGDAELGDNA